ncbi:MAG: hypothetical protein KAJ18_00190 [Candidatus Omnitrophica bacterium]|nr:hypothetical protein [Candidatus Omnitrophota bacterium]
MAIKAIAPQDLKVSNLGVIKILSGINFFALEEYLKGKTAKESLYKLIIYMIKSPEFSYEQIEKFDETVLNEISQYLADLLGVGNQYAQYRNDNSIPESFQKALKESEVFKLPKKISEDFKSISNDFRKKAALLIPKQHFEGLNIPIYRDSNKLTKEQLLEIQAQTEEIKDLSKKLDKSFQKIATNNKDRKKTIISAFWAFILALCALYAYQYNIKPDVSITHIDAEMGKLSKKDEREVRFNFELVNDGKSKTINSKVYTTFIDWTVLNNSIFVRPLDLVETDTFELAISRKRSFVLSKYISEDRWIELSKLAGGFYCVVVYTWQGDNIVFRGRTFVNNKLLFLEPAMKNNKMIFNIKELDQQYLTKWFFNTPKELLFELVEKLPATRVVYGDISRWE